MRIRLGDADRARLGCPEWLTEDPDTFTIIEADLLQRAGIEPDDAVTEIYGTAIEGQDGMRRVSMLGWRIRVWLALRRADVKVAFDDLDFNLIEMRKEAVEPRADEAGKDEAESPSERSDSSTTP